MKKIYLLLTFIFLFSISTLFSQDEKVTPKFIGVSTCAPCHKSEKQGKQMEIWEKSKHKLAYNTLKTDEADKIATEKGFKTKAVETPECLKCHASGYDTDKANLGDKFKVEDGVQCETCHGAASEYKITHSKDKQKAKEKGLIIHEDKEKFCIGCHNSESPTFKEFEFEKMWQTIAHPVPKKN